MSVSKSNFLGGNDLSICQGLSVSLVFAPVVQFCRALRISEMTGQIHCSFWLVPNQVCSSGFIFKISVTWLIISRKWRRLSDKQEQNGRGHVQYGRGHQGYGRGYVKEGRGYINDGRGQIRIDTGQGDMAYG